MPTILPKLLENSYLSSRDEGPCIITAQGERTMTAITSTKAMAGSGHESLESLCRQLTSPSRYGELAVVFPAAIGYMIDFFKVCLGPGTDPSD